LNLQRARLQAIIEKKFGGRYLGVLLTLKESQRILPIIDPNRKFAICPMPFAQILQPNVIAMIKLKKGWK
jgi:hypothetical protein